MYMEYSQFKDPSYAMVFSDEENKILEFIDVTSIISKKKRNSKKK
jgi:hypothetical protein